MFDAFDLVAPVNALRNVQPDDAYVALGKKGMIVHVLRDRKLNFDQIFLSLETFKRVKYLFRRPGEL